MIRRAVGVGLVLAGVLLFAMQPAGASDYILRQEIRLIDCTLTSTEDGTGGTTATECEQGIPPTVAPIRTTNGRPIISGALDANTLFELRVIVAGHVYTLGASPQLTVDGDRWRLDLSGLARPIPPGTYNVIVEVVTIDSLLLRDGSVGELVVVSASDGNEPGGQVPGAGTPDTGVGRGGVRELVAIGSILVAIVLVGLWLWKVLGRRDT